MSCSPAKEKSYPEPTSGFFPDHFPNLRTQVQEMNLAPDCPGNEDMQASLPGLLGLEDLASDPLSVFSPSFLIRVIILQ